MEEPVFLSETGEVQGTELLVMTVEIGDGRQDTINIHEKDDCGLLARAFAQKHNLDSSLENNLAMLIKQNKEMVEMRTNSPDNFKWAESSGNVSQQSAIDIPEASTIHNKSSYEQNRGNVYERLYKQGARKAQPALAQPAFRAR